MIKVLLDTDIGGDIDDAICLAYLLKEPKCELLGITTVCGESEKRAAVADAICQAANRTLPIVAGEDLPMRPIPLYPTPEGAAALCRWEHKNYQKSDAPAFLYEQIKTHPHEAVLVGIGNMTNIALLFSRHPDAPSLLKGLYVMNGYFGKQKLPDPYDNWNSWADPLASEIVFSAKPALHRAITLDVTRELTLEAERAAALFHNPSPLIHAVLDFGGAWLSDTRRLTFHDPLAAVSVFHDVCTFKRGFVSVETEEKSNMGGTAFLSDERGNVEISVSADAPLFFERLTSAINS